MKTAEEYCTCQNEGWRMRNGITACRNCLKPINPKLLPIDGSNSKNPADQFLKDKGFEHPIKISSDTTDEYSLFELLEQYHESRMKEELIDFQKWYYDKYYGLEIEDSEERIIDNYLATRKNK